VHVQHCRCREATGECITADAPAGVWLKSVARCSVCCCQASLYLLSQHSTQRPAHPHPPTRPTHKRYKVLRLADQLRAERCEAAAARALAAADPLDWSTVLAVYNLPPSCSDNAAYAPLFDAAAMALQQRLGDLDAAWLHDGKAEQLLALPFAAVKQLLSHDRTCACENTVYYTCCAWIEKHMYKAGAEQRSGLLECVRMPHVSS